MTEDNLYRKYVLPHILSQSIQERRNTMFFMGGISSRVSECGRLEDHPCPHCGRRCTLVITKAYDYVHAFFLPVWKYHITYLATCTCCGQTWELRPDLGRAVEHGDSPILTAADLAPASHLSVGVAKPAACPQCGAILSPGGRFCPQCGIRLPDGSNQ